jgi:hypothetical protein
MATPPHLRLEAAGRDFSFIATDSQKFAFLRKIDQQLSA